MMTRTKILKSFALAAAISFGSTVGVAAEHEEEEAFQIGGSCAALAYSSAADLHALIQSGYADDFHSFCYPEEPSECGDYSAHLKGVGRLVTGEDGYHCSLVQ